MMVGCELKAKCPQGMSYNLRAWDNTINEKVERMKHKISLWTATAVLVLFYSITACNAEPVVSIEEHEILLLPSRDEMTPTIKPLQGKPEDILAKREVERIKPAQTFALPVQIGNHTINVTERFTEDYDVSENITVGRSFVEVYDNDLLEMTIDAGVISPINNFRGLWVYESHWFGEVAHIEEDPADPNAAFIIWGEIIQDGKSLNKSQGYDEAFNFQILNGKPFYLFSKGDEMGFSYDGTETALDYSKIIHYQCCSGAAYNPSAAENMVSFFATKDSQSYYVEMGVFD